MNDGFLNEKQLIDYINHNNYENYNENIKSFLRFLFGADFDQDMPFSADKATGQIKPDLVISHNGVAKYVSIKKGSGNSVHQESIKAFFPFFENLLGTDALTNLKLFHYGDDTIDDSGTIRYDAEECKKRYSEQICKINELINQETNLLCFLDRFLFVGNVGTTSVDAIYHGTINDGLWASKEEIINYILNNDFSSSKIHFGPLTYQPWGRNNKREAKYPERRYIMQIKWDRINKDLSFIRMTR